MGRPEALNAEKKAEALACVSKGEPIGLVAMTYGVSELTLRRYMKQATYSENDRMRGEEAAREAANTMKTDEPPMPEAA